MKSLMPASLSYLWHTVQFMKNLELQVFTGHYYEARILKVILTVRKLGKIEWSH